MNHPFLFYQHILATAQERCIRRTHLYYKIFYTPTTAHIARTSYRDSRNLLSNKP